LTKVSWKVDCILASMNFDLPLDLKCTSNVSLLHTHRRFAMTDVQEICNLSDEDLEARRIEIARGLAPKAHERRDLSGGLVLSFDATPEMRAELDDFVAFERECCPTLGLSVREASGALELEIQGIAPGSSIFASVGLTAEPKVSSSGRWQRILSSAGLGTLGALVVCCVLPIGLVALLGAAVAAPFANLDNPWVISSSALVFAGSIWLWQRRREAARATEASAGGCGC
jgi:hypothetical protein